ncbi:unnamed protein product [Victoria cruziana]
MIVTPADVPHSRAVASSGVKCDVVPGRLNQTSISIQREGVYYGLCSEIRGTNHASTRVPGYVGRLLSPLWLSRTTRGASHLRSKLLHTLVDGIPLCGWHSRNHGALHTEQARLQDETPVQGPKFSLGGRTKDLWKSGLPCPHGNATLS